MRVFYDAGRLQPYMDKDEYFNMYDRCVFLFEEEIEMFGEVWFDDDELSKVELIV